MDAIFGRDGEAFVPGELARGPWTPQAQHGGAPAALLARAVESCEGGEAMFVARLTIELLRPVPIAPLTVAVGFERPGRKVQLVRASLRSGDAEVARATGLRIRRADVAAPPELAHIAPPPPPSSGVGGNPPWAAPGGYIAFHSHGVEHRFVAGSFREAGPATDWIRLRVPLVEGEAASPLCRVAAAADFGNGVSWVLHRDDGYSFINPDLTIYLFRAPVGEWICLDARTHVGPSGTGLAESTLFDEQGCIGRSLQSLLIEK
ncbi:MAG TPA: thioesterase family protein [Terriglobales bacterium]|nr:thioesterase family protein [Terriglobales bacterium]